MKEKLIYKVELDLIKSICGLNYPKSITKTCEFLHITEEFGGDIVKEQFINKINFLQPYLWQCGKTEHKLSKEIHSEFLNLLSEPKFEELVFILDQKFEEKR